MSKSARAQRGALGSDERSKSDNGVSSILGLGRYLIRHAPAHMLLAQVFMVLASITEGLSVLLLVPILKLIDPAHADPTLAISTGPFGELLGSHVRVGLASVLTGLVIVIVVRAALIRQKDIFTSALMYDFINSLRNGLFESVAGARWSFLARVRGSDINHALTADIDRVQMAAMQFLLLIQTFIMLLIYAGVALTISPMMSLFAGAIGVVVVGLMTPIRRIAMRYGKTLTTQRLEQYRIVSEFLAGVKVAKAANAEPMYVSQLSATLGVMRSGTLRFMRVYTLGSLFFQTATSIGLAAFVYGAVGRYHMAYSSIIALIFLFARLAPRFTQIHGAVQDMLTNIPALDAMLRLQNACDQNREIAVVASSDKPTLEDSIVFERVSFNYLPNDESSPVLSDVSFVVPARAITAIVGPSGSGKSTVADLIMGLLEPQNGTILVDGIGLDQSRRRAWRDMLAYVPQESFLLHDSIAANLALGKSGVSETEMWNALRTANAEKFVSNLAGGLATIVGDRGMRLSGGERQRIALARAVLRRPSLLLLDEATSALDWEGQSLIASAIQALRGQMTVITIAHRPSMIAFADWVVAIEDGKIVETGRYDELASARGSHLHQILAGDR